MWVTLSLGDVSREFPSWPPSLRPAPGVATPKPQVVRVVEKSREASILYNTGGQEPRIRTRSRERSFVWFLLQFITLGGSGTKDFEQGLTLTFKQERNKGWVRSLTNWGNIREDFKEGLVMQQAMREIKGRTHLEKASRNMQTSRSEGGVNRGLTASGGRVREEFRIDREPSRTRGRDKGGLTMGGWGKGQV